MSDILRGIACWDTPDIETKNTVNKRRKNHQIFNNNYYYKKESYFHKKKNMAAILDYKYSLLDSVQTKWGKKEKDYIMIINMLYSFENTALWLV